MSAKSNRTAGRKIKLETALPAAYVAFRWGCTDRHARRLIADNSASPPPWHVISAMLCAVELGASGKCTPEEALDSFNQALRAEED